MRFPAKKNAACPKAPSDFPSRKEAFSTPSRVALGLLFPSPRFCTDGRTDGRTDGPAGLRWCHNQNFSQICLPMVPRSAAFGRKGAALLTNESLRVHLVS